jgi:hypothetical protein
VSRRQSSFDPVEAAAEARERRARERQLEREGPDLSIERDQARRLERAQVLVVTSATNDAPLERRFWAALSRYAHDRRAMLTVVPVRYRNPTSPTEDAVRRPKWWWPPEVVPHLAASDLRFHRHICVLGSVRIQPTAVHPLTGLQGLSRGTSAIFGHPQVAMETVPAPRRPAILYTTGSVSQARYSESKAGTKGAFHHALGALVVERDGPRVHVRHLRADSAGGFYDLDTYWTGDGPRPSEGALAVITGDTHVELVDPDVVRGTYGPGGLVELVRPRHLVWHDVLDFFARSHWDDPIDRQAKASAGRADVGAELERTCAFIRAHTPKGCRSVVVWSNHHDHLRRWVLSSDWRSESPANAEVLLELALAMRRGARVTRQGVRQIDPFAWWATSRGGLEAVRFLAPGESFVLGGHELTYHGHRAARGARGSRRNLQVGVRLVIGHGHAPGITHGVSQVGTSGPELPSYALGSPTANVHTHAVLQPSGKVQLVTLWDGRFRA